MEWPQVLAIILGNAAMFFPIFFWLRAESNADRRDLLGIINSSRTEMIEQMNCNRMEVVSILNEMKQEMKDFHGRLCSIEERNRK